MTINTNLIHNILNIVGLLVGALILAEIERLDRKDAREHGGGNEG